MAFWEGSGKAVVHPSRTGDPPWDNCLDQISTFLGELPRVPGVSLWVTEVAVEARTRRCSFMVYSLPSQPCAFLDNLGKHQKSLRPSLGCRLRPARVTGSFQGHLHPTAWSRFSDIWRNWNDRNFSLLSRLNPYLSFLPVPSCSPTQNPFQRSETILQVKDTRGPQVSRAELGRQSTQVSWKWATTPSTWNILPFRNSVVEISRGSRMEWRPLKCQG